MTKFYLKIKTVVISLLVFLITQKQSYAEIALSDLVGSSKTGSEQCLDMVKINSS